MNGHTPGPWRAQGAIGGYLIVSDSTPTGRRIVRGSGGIVTPADARLIAAAPDLLAACKAIEPHIADTHPPTENEHPYLTAVRQLRAAIAKAEGAE